jgi:hypothetical protein
MNQPSPRQRWGESFTDPSGGTSAGIAAAGAAFFATLHGHGSYASAYRNGVLVTAAITAVALILTLTDRHRAALVHADQGDHWDYEH